MTKSIYVIAGLGVLGCIVMSMMMQHVLKVTKDKAVPPVVTDIQSLHGSRLRQLCRVDVAETPEHTRIEVTAYPAQGSGTRRLAKDLGQFVWRRYAVRQIVDEVVVVIDLEGREPERVDVEAPMLARRKLRPKPAAPALDLAPPQAGAPAAGAAPPAGTGR